MSSAFFRGYRPLGRDSLWLKPGLQEVVSSKRGKYLRWQGVGEDKDKDLYNQGRERNEHGDGDLEEVDALDSSRDYRFRRRLQCGRPRRGLTPGSDCHR